MTPPHQLKLAILRKAIDWGDLTLATDAGTLTPDEIEALYDQHEDLLQDAREEIRCTGFTTDIQDPTPWMRGLDNYEHESHALQLEDGSWVGWTYWYGGGKHAEPSSIPWMEYAYALNCTETQVMVTQRLFTKHTE